MLTHTEARRVARLWATSAPYSQERALANRVLLAHIRAVPKAKRSGVIWALCGVASDVIHKRNEIGEG